MSFTSLYTTLSTGGAIAVIYYFCHCMSLHICPGDNFILGSCFFFFLLFFFGKKLPFGFLLVVFWLWCRCFVRTFSPWCLGRKVLGNCIESWSLPSFLFKWYLIFKSPRMGWMIPKDIKYNLHYGEVRGDVLRPQHGDTVAMTNIGLQTKKNGDRGTVLERTAGTNTGNFITKTSLFKFTENFTTKQKKKISDKNSDIFHISAQNIDYCWPARHNFSSVGWVVKLQTNQPMPIWNQC